MNWWQMVCVTMFPSDCRCGTSMELSATSIKMMNISHADDEENWQSALRNLWDVSLWRTSSVNEMNDERWIPLWCELTQFSKWFHDLPFNINHDDFFKECCPLLLNVKGHCDQLSIQLLHSPSSYSSSLSLAQTLISSNNFLSLDCALMLLPTHKKALFFTITAEKLSLFSSPKAMLHHLTTLSLFSMDGGKVCTFVGELPIGLFFCKFLSLPLLQLVEPSLLFFGLFTRKSWPSCKFCFLLSCCLFQSSLCLIQLCESLSGCLQGCPSWQEEMCEILLSRVEELLKRNETNWSSCSLLSRTSFAKKQKLKNRALQISENDRMTAQLFTYLTAPVVWILFLEPRHPIIKILDQLHYPANFLLNMEIRVKWPLLNGSFLNSSFWSFATSLARLFRNCWLKLEWMTTDKSRNATVCWKMCFLPLNQFKSALQSSSWSIWTSPSSKFYLRPMEFSQTVSSHCQTHLVGSPCHLQVTAIWMQSFSYRKQIWHHWHFGEWINQELQHSSSFPPNPKHSKLT